MSFIRELTVYKTYNLLYFHNHLTCKQLLSCDFIDKKSKKKLYLREKKVNSGHCFLHPHNDDCKSCSNPSNYYLARNHLIFVAVRLIVGALAHCSDVGTTGSVLCSLLTSLAKGVLFSMMTVLMSGNNIFGILFTEYCN